MFSSKGTNPIIKNKFPVYHDIRAIGVGSNVLYLTVQCPKCHFTTVHDISLHDYIQNSPIAYISTTDLYLQWPTLKCVEEHT